MSVTMEYKISIYKKDPVLFGIYFFLSVFLFSCLIFLGSLQWENYLLIQEAEELSVKIEQKQFIQERAMRQKEKNIPDDRRIVAMLKAQKSAEPRLYPQLLDAIEQTWSPRLAILSLKLESAGQNAKLDITVTDLEEAFLFVERLNAVNPQTIATLVRHGTRAVSDQSSTLVAHIEIERS